MKKAIFAAPVAAALLVGATPALAGDFDAPIDDDGGSGNNNQGSAKKGKGMRAGKLIFKCILLADISIFREVDRLGGRSDDPRDLTMVESQRAAERGCVAFAVLRVFYPWPDNSATYQVARMSHRWRKTAEGRMMMDICRRGPMDGCADNGMAPFSSAMVRAYQTGEVTAQFVQTMRGKGVVVKYRVAGKPGKKQKKA